MSITPKYLPAVLSAIGSPKPGAVVEVYVLHDDDCPLLAGAGPCVCEPLVTVGFRLWHRTRCGE
ncbi:MAG: hypothetical protein K2V38_19585, partial [Gemmataceae bacterium]|nr:hypothetical protein [Gemmataceae bacterium]